MYVGVDGKTRRRQQALQRYDIVAFEPQSVGQLEPARDAAFALVGAVVIDKTAAPLAAGRRIFAARDQVRILYRDHRLIVVPVQRPRLNLAFAARAAVQEPVERMQPMIAPRADVAQASFQLFWAERIQSTISIPSSATSNPAAATLRRSAEPSIRIGLVLLMWVKMRRPGRLPSAARVPS